MKSYIAGWLLSLSLFSLSFGQGLGGNTGGAVRTGGTTGGIGGGLTTGGTGATATRAGGLTSGTGFGGSSAFGAVSGTTGTTGQATGGQTTGSLGLGSFGQTGAATGGDPFAAATSVFGSSASSLLGTASLNRTIGNALGGLTGAGRGGIGGANSRTGLGQTGNQSQNQSKLRTSVRLGFQMPAAPASERAQAVQARLARIPIGSGARNVQVSMDGRTAVLRGRIPTKADALIVERLLKLEPGIDEVRNELVTDDSQPQS